MRCKNCGADNDDNRYICEFAALLFMTKAILTMQTVLTTTELKLLKQ